MSSFHDWYEQMSDPSLDEPTADSILLGMVPPDDAPPGYAGLAALARHVTMAAGAPELAGESTVVELMVAASASADPQRMPTMRKALLAKKLLTAKVATVAVIGTFGLGSAAAAAAGVLPGQSHTRSETHPSPISSVWPAVGNTVHAGSDTTVEPTDVTESTVPSVPTTEPETGSTTVPTTVEHPESGDPGPGVTEDTTDTTQVTIPDDTGANSTPEDQPATSTPPTTEATGTQPEETQPEETPSTSVPAEWSDSGATTSGTSTGGDQTSTESDGGQTTGTTTAPPTTSAASDG